MEKQLTTWEEIKDFLPFFLIMAFFFALAVFG